jgi:hypothetical protein
VNPLLGRIDRERNIVNEMIVEIQAVSRLRELQLLEWPTATVVGTAIDIESAFCSVGSMTRTFTMAIISVGDVAV